MHGYTHAHPGVNGKSHRRRRSQFHKDQRLAVLRAFTGAKAYLAGLVPTLAAAARGCGSNVAYVGAAVTILRANDPAIERRALRGHTSLLAAANKLRPVIRATDILGKMDEKTRIALFHQYGDTDDGAPAAPLSPRARFEQLVSEIGTDAALAWLVASEQAAA